MRHDPKGKHLPGFLTLVSQQLSDEREQLLLEVETLCRNVEHTKTIVATQQSYAGVSGVVEPVTIGELLDDALRMYSASLDKHGFNSSAKSARFRRRRWKSRKCSRFSST